MSQFQPFYVFPREAADSFRAATAEMEMKIDPQEIALGEYAGQWIVSALAYNDYPTLRAQLDLYPIKQLDMETLWPPLDF